MKDGFRDIIGKRIAAVVVAKSDHAPRQQIFLVFPNGTRFEIYGENFSCCSGLDRAEGIERYVESGGGEVVRVYGDASVLEPARVPLSTGPEPRPRYNAPAADQSLEGLLQRDLDAWNVATAAIARAKGG